MSVKQIALPIAARYVASCFLTRLPIYDSMDTTVQNQIADQRVALERANREIQVRAQVDMLRLCMELGAPSDNVLCAVETMLMENLCQR